MDGNSYLYENFIYLGIKLTNYAVDKIKALAEHITLSCDEDGVAYGIRKWVI